MDHDHILLAQLVKEADELRPVAFGPGDFLLIEALAPRRLERGTLELEMLIVGRDAGVADDVTFIDKWREIFSAMWR